MNKKNKITTLVFTIAAFIGFAETSLGQNRAVLAKAQQITGDRFTFTAKTPNGANILAVNKPSAATLRAIDNGLTNLFALAKKNKYRKRVNYADYTIYIGKADRTKNAAGEYSPDIAVGAAQYAGSAYDQGGFIYAAGMVVANDPCSFVIAEHSKDLNRITDVVRYEGEHLILYHNDRRRYAATADHSRGGGHPILK